MLTNADEPVSIPVVINIYGDNKQVTEEEEESFMGMRSKPKILIGNPIALEQTIKDYKEYVEIMEEMIKARFPSPTAKS